MNSKLALVKSQPTFLGLLFRNRHRRAWEPEMEIPRDETRTAFWTLRQRTGLSWTQLQFLLGVPAAMLQSMERVNGPIKPALCKRCAEIARDFQLPMLAMWFDQREQSEIRKPARGRGRKAK